MTTEKITPTARRLMAYAAEQELPWYCRRGEAPRRLADDYDAGRPVPEWVRAALADTSREAS